MSEFSEKQAGFEMKVVKIYDDLGITESDYEAVVQKFQLVREENPLMATEYPKWGSHGPKKVGDFSAQVIQALIPKSVQIALPPEGPDPKEVPRVPDNSWFKKRMAAVQG
jgi:hypothetical protein